MTDTSIRHIENHWKALTLSSNESFNAGAFNEALSGYQVALCQAEVLNNQQADCQRVNIPFMQVYIISCNNLSNTYHELRQYAEAENMLNRVVCYLLHLSAGEHVDGAELKNELNRAIVALFNFIGKNPDKILQ